MFATDIFEYKATVRNLTTHLTLIQNLIFQYNYLPLFLSVVIFLRQYDQVSSAKMESIQFEKVQEQLKCKPGRQHYDKSQGMLLIVMYSVCTHYGQDTF